MYNGVFDLTYWYALLLVAGCLYLKLLSTYLPPHLFFQVLFGLPLPLWSCGFHCRAYLAILSSFLLSVGVNQFHFFLSWYSTVSRSVPSIALCWLFCLASMYLQSFANIY